MLPVVGVCMLLRGKVLKRTTANSLNTHFGAMIKTGNKKYIVEFIG